MIINVKNLLSGRINTMDLPVTDEQIRRWRSGELIQKAMPHLTSDEREFLLSGMLPGEFPTEEIE